MVVEPPGPVTEKLTASPCRASVLPPSTPVSTAPIGANLVRLDIALLTTKDVVVEDGW